MNKTHRQHDSEHCDDVGIRAVFMLDDQGLKIRHDDLMNHLRVLRQYCKGAYPYKVLPVPMYAHNGFIHYQMPKPGVLAQACSSGDQEAPGEPLRSAPRMDETLSPDAAPCMTSPATEPSREACNAIVVVNGRPVMSEADLASVARRSPRRMRSVEFQLSGVNTSHLITDKKQHVTLQSGNAPDGAAPGMLIDAIVEHTEMVIIAGADAIDLQMELPLVGSETE